MAQFESFEIKTAQQTAWSRHPESTWNFSIDSSNQRRKREDLLNCGWHPGPQAEEGVD